MKSTRIMKMHASILVLALMLGTGCGRNQGPLLLGESATMPETASQWEKVVVEFEIDGAVGNFFDPQDVEVNLILTLPNKEEVTHPAFYTVDHNVVLDHGREIVRRTGGAHWELRWTPAEAGIHEWRIRVSSQGQMSERAGRTSVIESSGTGFVKISKRDKSYFETSDGDFFYPVGHGTRSPEDSHWQPLGGQSHAQEAPMDSEGRLKILKYEEWFSNMHENGENCCSVWMSPWWLGLEWSPVFPGYEGLGKYNQIHAAQLDRLFEIAEKYEIRILLYTMNHGMLSTVVDREWFDNPYRLDGDTGLAKEPADFFRSEECRRLHKNKMRYLLARWGSSPSLFGIILCTEVQWVDTYNGREADEEAHIVDGAAEPNREIGSDKRGVIDWFRHIATYVRETDIHHHPVSIQFATLDEGHEFWSSDEFDIVLNNAYSTQLISNNVTKHLNRNSCGLTDGLFGWKQHFRDFQDKPVMVAEWGGHHMHNSKTNLAAQLHVGVWAMSMSDFGGVMGFWWWNEIHTEDLYSHHRPVVEFFKGYDRREKKLISTQSNVTLRVQFTDEDREEFLPHPTRSGLMLNNKVEVFAYVVHHDINSSDVFVDNNASRLFPKAFDTFIDLPPELNEGNYRVEFWDPFTGDIVEVRDIHVPPAIDEPRRIQLFPFRVDLAMKIYPDTRDRN